MEQTEKNPKDTNCNPESKPILSNNTDSEPIYFIKVPASTAEIFINLYGPAQWPDKAREVLADHVRGDSVSG